MSDQINNALKAISQTDDELRVANYIVLFGGRDLTGFVYGKNADGSGGEYFTKSTNLESEYTKSGVLHVDFEHGMDPDKLGLDQDAILGYVDWKTATVDDRGVFVERVLNRRKKYVQWIEELINAGLVGNSSEAIGDKVKKAKDGEITDWPLRRDTFTVTPMEPRMLSENAFAAAKALADAFPHLKSLLPPEQAALPIDGDAKPIEPQLTGEGKIMTDNIDVKGIVAAEIAAAKAQWDAEAKAAELKAAELKAAEEAGYQKALEEVRSGDYSRKAFNTVPVGFSEEKDAVPAFKHWLKTGQPNQALISPDASMLSIKAAYNVTTDASGAYLVPDPLYNQIIAKRDLASWVRSAPCQYFQTNSDHLLIPYEDTSQTAFVSTSESGTYSNNEGTVGQHDLALIKYTKEVRATEEFMSVENSNFDSWLMNTLGRAVAVTENTVATTAVLNGVGAAAAAASATALTIAEVDRLIGTLTDGYNVQGQCGFLMKNATYWYLRGIDVTNYQPGWNFEGYPVYISDNMAAMTAGLKSTLFGNFNYFAVLERPGILVQRNPYLYMATGTIGIFANIYRAFKVLQTEAFYTMAQA